MASPDQLATQAGIAALAVGGSAADAAVAANAVLAVTFQHQCGLGGDLMAIVRSGEGEVVGVESAGPAGSLVRDSVAAAGGRHQRLLPSDPAAVTLPGCLDGWLLLHERFGRLPWSDLFDAAHTLAARGFAVTTQLASDLVQLPDCHLVDEWLRPDGPAAGAGPAAPALPVRAPLLASTLERVAARPDRSALFAGAAADALLRMPGSPFTAADLDRPVARLVEPLRLVTLGAELVTLPPVSQGYLTLASCAVLERLGLATSTPDDPEALATAVESWIVLGHDRAHRLGDGADPSALLDPTHLDQVADAVRQAGSLQEVLTAALCRTPSTPGPAPVAGEDTISIVAADDAGQAVVLVQSLGSRFGARRPWPGTGILLHSRGMGFSTDPDHPACLAPGRRPPHTLSPTFATVDPASGRSDLAWVALGTMGADSQPQILTQLLWRLFGGERTTRPAAALGAPRATVAASAAPPHPASNGFWTWEADGLTVDVEVQEDDGTRARRLIERGHQVRYHRVSTDRFGHAQLVALHRSGTLEAASDPRSPAGAALTR